MTKQIRIADQEIDVRNAVILGAKYIADFETLSCVGEIADAAFDQAEVSWNLDAAQCAELYAEIQREVLHLAGLPADYSDAADVPFETVKKIAQNGEGK